MKKSLLTAAVALTLASGAAQSATLTAGETFDVKILADGVSCFTFGDCTSAPAGSDSYMQDNDNDATATNGSAIAGDGYAGIINITTTSDGAGGVNFTVNSYNLDTYIATAGGFFGTFAPDTSGMSGSVSADGDISLDVTGRMGVAQFFAGSIMEQLWNTGSTFTSGSQTNGGGLTLTGIALALDGSALAVSASDVGPDWLLFAGTPYSEVFSLDFSMGTVIASPTPPIPVPAAVWLFGSGLLGLVGVARRKKSA